MARQLQLWWEGAALAGLPRRDRRGGQYEAYLPDPLVDREFLFGAAEAADLAEAESEIKQFDRASTALADTEALARLLLRAESVASSKIEGLEVGPRRLLRADFAARTGAVTQDLTAAEVLGNVNAMAFAIDAASSGPITVAALRETNRVLLDATIPSMHAGQIRTVQNWIGGSNYNPCSAAFVPPPPEAVPDLLKDLCKFSNDDVLPTVAQAAIAHAQFETIHPFIDGNGRVGRALIHMIFRRRGLVTTTLLPVSLVLATRAKDYISGLTSFRYVGKSTSRAARDGTNDWVATFAAACRQAVRDSTEFERRIATIQDDWRARIAPVRSDAAAMKLIDVLPGAPIVSVATAAALIGRAFTGTFQAIVRLTEAGILTRARAGRQRGQIYEARDIINAFIALERRLASPASDTKIALPARRRA